jgi:hypothetical protein
MKNFGNSGPKQKITDEKKEHDLYFSKALVYLMKINNAVNKDTAAKLNISPQRLSDIKGGASIHEVLKYRICSLFNLSYDKVYTIGFNIANNKAPEDFSSSHLAWDPQDNDKGDFLKIPFSDNLTLSPEGGPFIPITHNVENTPVVVYSKAIKRSSSKGLQAFKITDKTLDPVISPNSLIIVDTELNNPYLIKNNHIYVVCIDLLKKDCSPFFLTTAEPQRSIIVYSPNYERYPPIFRKIENIQVVGLVIWSQKEF